MDQIKPYQARRNKIKTMENDISIHIHTCPHIILASCHKPGFLDAVNHAMVDADYALSATIVFLVKIPPVISLILDETRSSCPISDHVIYVYIYIYIYIVNNFILVPDIAYSHLRVPSHLSIPIALSSGAATLLPFTAKRHLSQMPTWHWRVSILVQCIVKRILLMGQSVIGYRLVPIRTPHVWCFRLPHTREGT